MQSKYDKFSIKLESDEGLDELMEFLHLKRVEFTLQSEKRIISRLRYKARKLGLLSFSELLVRLKSDPKVNEDVVNWLEKGRSFNEEDHSFSPLITRKTSLKEFVNTSMEKPKEQRKRKKLKPLNLEFVSGMKLPDDQKNLVYKPNHFLRRLHARMKRVETETYKEYHKLLETNHKEFSLLMENYSINVTRFFRDKELFIALEKTVIPKILKNKNKSVRIWSAGCAIGPEPYSMAILMNGKLGQDSINKVFLLATDINQGLLLQAKKGIYTSKSLEEVDSSRMMKYFKTLDSDLFQISAYIRNSVTFQQHDLRTPPPAKNFDIIMCRNVLIYFSRVQSKYFFQQFHSALKSRGYLVLGKCEVLPQFIKDKFEIIDSRNRIYRKKI
ncbi:MAG: CheR family methyltransferase [Candidatus Hodarchaeales archaeon]|jgi:chemotaxis methyl-accepting protein methylase